MGKERYGNGYKGRASRRRRMRSPKRGYAGGPKTAGRAKGRMAQALKYGLYYGKAWR